MNAFYKILLLAIGLVFAGCNQQSPITAPEPVAISLSGKEFFEPERPEQIQLKLDSNLQVARKNFEANPSEENYIWLGRRLAYLNVKHGVVMVMNFHLLDLGQVEGYLLRE